MSQELSAGPGPAVEKLRCDKCGKYFPKPPKRSFSPNDGPYENELIGAFLLQAGFMTAQANHKKAIWANLYQQSPVDQKAGDLVIGSTRFFAIEFKRVSSRSTLKQERKKWCVIAASRYLQTSNTYDLSGRSHFLVVGTKSESGWRMKYRAFADVIIMNLDAEPELFLDTDGLIKEVVRHKSPFGCSADEMLRYLIYLSRCRHGHDALEGNWTDYFLGIGISNRGLVFHKHSTLIPALEAIVGDELVKSINAAPLPQHVPTDGNTLEVEPITRSKPGTTPR